VTHRPEKQQKVQIGKKILLAHGDEDDLVFGPSSCRQDLQHSVVRWTCVRFIEIELFCQIERLRMVFERRETLQEVSGRSVCSCGWHLPVYRYLCSPNCDGTVDIRPVILNRHQFPSRRFQPHSLAHVADLPPTSRPLCRGGVNAHERRPVTEVHKRQIYMIPR
jgi:hypothetical protein